jgi:ubiquitin related modifier 1
MLFSNQRTFKLALPPVDSTGTPIDISFLVHHLCEKVMKDSRKELFVLDGTV